jgi:hypothetical protein
MPNVKDAFDAARGTGENVSVWILLAADKALQSGDEFRRGKVREFLFVEILMRDSSV